MGRRNSRNSVNACQTSWRLRNSKDTLRLSVRWAYVSRMPRRRSVTVRYLGACARMLGVSVVMMTLQLHSDLPAIAQEGQEIEERHSFVAPLQLVYGSPQHPAQITLWQVRKGHCGHAAIELFVGIGECDCEEWIEDELGAREWGREEGGLYCERAGDISFGVCPSRGALPCTLTSSPVSPLVAVLQVLQHGAVACASIDDAELEQDELE